MSKQIDSALSNSGPTTVQSRSTLVAASGAHIVQDGLVAMQFVLFPLLAQSFGLSYAQVGMLRAVNSTAMSLLEMPSGFLAERFGEGRLLVIGLLMAGAGYLAVAGSALYGLLLLAFLVAGIGGAFQHSLSSSLLARTFGGAARRRALGLYNASGDAGKLLFTGLFSAGIGAGFAWSELVIVLALSAIAFALVLHLLLPAIATVASHTKQSEQPSGFGIIDRRRFGALVTLVFLDSLIQAVFLIFLAFVIIDKGFSASIASTAVVVALVGGMCGKFVAGYIAARFGDGLCFFGLQVLTVLSLVGVVLIPGWLVFYLLPFAGLAIQGTSTVCYGKVPDFIDPTSHSHAKSYAIVYTAATAASIVGPLVFGALADRYDINASMAGLALLALLTLPLTHLFSSPITQGQ